MSQDGLGGVSQEAQDMQAQFWHKQLQEISNMSPNGFKMHELPLARIKKIMKLDDEVKMISAEAPVLFSKAAEIFISELSLRAWIHTEENKRRTLQRNDIAMAITKYDQFDFLIDIVPREEIKTTTKRPEDTQRTPVMADQVQYFFQLAQQAGQNTSTTASSGSSQPVLQLGGTNIPAITIQPQTMGEISQPIAPQQQQQQIIQIQVPQTQQTQQQQVVQQQAHQQPTQVFQQVLTSTGEIQNVPIQLTPAQIQAITLQMQGKQPGQPILIQTQPQSDDQSQGDHANDLTQSLFPINIGGQQVYIQQADDSLQDDVHDG